MDPNNTVSLATLGGGSAIERFDDELRRVLSNIIDPNTTDGAREVTLKVKIKPNEDRDRCDVDVTCSSRICPAKSFSTMMFVGSTPSGAVATEHNPKQLQMDLDAARSPKIVPMQSKEA